jgi:aerobic-type carbon monoxide dehydrogenase small subunit (CoxS/CutS family)
MKLVINGADVELDGRYAKTPLPWVLRDIAGLHDTKFGCGAGFCAARTVLIDGRSTKSCQTATERAVCKAITTVEGGPPARLPTPPAIAGGQRGIDAARYAAVEREG